MGRAAEVCAPGAGAKKKRFVASKTDVPEKKESAFQCLAHMHHAAFVCEAKILPRATFDSPHMIIATIAVNVTT